MATRSPVALVLGVGPGLGGAIVRKWTQMGWQVACASRGIEKGNQIAAELGPSVKPFSCDVSNAQNVADLVDKVEEEMGPIEYVCYNAGSGVWKNYDAITPAEFEMCWRVNTLGLLHTAQIIAPRMVQRGKGAIGITGATASLRGKPFTSGFASAKAAQRSLAQSLARDLGPKGVHVYYVIIDCMVDLATTRARMPDAPDEKFLSPNAAAQTYWDLAQQPKTCWSFELDVRPAVENW